MPREFVHLHNHTEYSALDGLSSVKEMVARAVELKQRGFGITDHGNMAGVFKFHKACKASDIIPVIGMEGYFVRTIDEAHNQNVDRRHITLLAQSSEGYKNLLAISSKAFTEGFWQKPRLDYDILEDHAKGIVATTGCVGGEIPKLIANGEHETARTTAQTFIDILGKDNFYVEIMQHGNETEGAVIPHLVALAKELELKLLATNDCHYTHAHQSTVHEALLCIGTNNVLSNEKRFRFDGEHFHIRSAEEMEEAMSGVLGEEELSEAFASTIEITERADFEIEENIDLMPEFKIEGKTQDEALKDMVFNGAKEIYGSEYDNTIKERLDYELSVITTKGFSNYFLVVADIIKYAKTQNIKTSKGRGSAAGSLVSYCSGITQLDPIKHGLFFERFLNPGRDQMPDIDIDFGVSGREKVLKYLSDKYGNEHVARIGTFNRQNGKSAIDDAFRVYEISGEAPAIKEELPEDGFIIKDALKPDGELGKISERFSSDAIEALEIAAETQGVLRNVSKHAGGIVLSKEPIYKHVPVRITGERDGNITQWDMYDVEAIGMLKIDALTIIAVDIISDAMEAAGITDTDIPEPDETEENKPVFKMIASGDVDGIFQLESKGMRSLLKRIKPMNLSELAACSALYRPAAMGSLDEQAKGFLDNKKKLLDDPSSVNYPIHEDMEDILKETNGILIYQEQMMQMAQKFANYSLGEADLLRRACGKKEVELMSSTETKFKERVLETGYTPQIAKELWDKILPFAGYGFNKSHAYAYSLLSWDMSWLKYHYKKEFWASVLSSHKEATRIKRSRIGAIRDGVSLSNPDINKSHPDKYVVDEGKILTPFNKVKQIGIVVAQKIYQNQPYKSFWDIFTQAQISSKGVMSLIEAGAFDEFGKRKSLYGLVAEYAGAGTAKHKKEFIERFSVNNLFEEEQGDERHAAYDEMEWGEDSLKKREIEALGVFIGGNPLEGAGYKKENNEAVFADFKEGSGMKNYQEIRIGVLGYSEKKTKAKKNMAYLEVIDIDGGVENAIIFPKTLSEDVRIPIVPGKCYVCKISFNADKDDSLSINSIEELEKTYRPQPAKRDSRIANRVSPQATQKPLGPKEKPPVATAKPVPEKPKVAKKTPPPKPVDIAGLQGALEKGKNTIKELSEII